jgi:hypothetical protein
MTWAVSELPVKVPRAINASYSGSNLRVAKKPAPVSPARADSIFRAKASTTNTLSKVERSLRQ